MPVFGETHWTSTW